MYFPELGEGKLIGDGTHSRVYVSGVQLYNTVQALSDAHRQKVTKEGGRYIALKRVLNDAELNELSRTLNAPFDEIKAQYLENIEREKAAMDGAMSLQVPHMVGHTRARIDA